MVEIPLANGRGVALVDDEDAARVSVYRWSLHSNGYAQSTNIRPRQTMLLHRVILDAPVGRAVDHINRDRLDCRRENIRLCTARENSGNVPKWATGCTSSFKGVWFDGRGRLVWRAQCGMKAVGGFVTEVEAALAYDAAARVRFGEFAALNFPRPGERSALGGDLAA